MSGSSPSDAHPRVSVVIPNYNGAAWLPGCLDALAAQTFEDYEILLVDNGSTDHSVPLLRERYAHVQLIPLERNRGFAEAVNIGSRAARGQYVALLNTDTVAKPDWLAALVRALDRSPATTAAVASKMLSLDNPGCIDDAGDALSWTGAAEKRGHGEPAYKFLHRDEVFSVCATRPTGRAPARWRGGISLWRSLSRHIGTCMTRSPVERRVHPPTVSAFSGVGFVFFRVFHPLDSRS
jgi:GT2 family glycosyltransferase